MHVLPVPCGCDADEEDAVCQRRGPLQHRVPHGGRRCEGVVPAKATNCLPLLLSMVVSKGGWPATLRATVGSHTHVSKEAH